MSGGEVGATVVHAEPSLRSHRGDERRGTRVDTPYSYEFVQALKARWPHGDRLWDEEEEVWWVVEGHEAAVEELVMEHFGGVLVVDEDGRETLRDASGDYEQEGLW